MGGKLIQSHFGLPEKRILRHEYFVLRDQLFFDFKSIYNTCRVETPFVLGDKETFGDIDILCNLQLEQIQKVIIEKYNIKPCLHGGVYSFPLNGFQVDVVQTDNQYFDIALAFYSYGDLGNLLGRLYGGLGIHFGHKGLFYKLLHSYFSGNPADVSPLNKIYVSTSFPEIIDYVGLNYSRWQLGFQNENEVFDFIESSRYFNPRLFYFEELNHQNRTRNRKRPMYARFVERISSKYKDVVIPRIAASYYFPYHVQKWPKMLEDINKFKPIYERQYILSRKWSGDLIVEITGLKDKELGKFIVAYKKSFESFTDFILNNSIDKIKESVRLFYQEYINTIVSQSAADGTENQN